ncbi:CAP domain-containing protein [Gilvimarinus agarilyticus]|uniref:CAP domain-containing protein n=1 Tax=unclassified Gilvimarinus TaxID=2642066 RepID=UPI001C08F193|nr:MULTISPECIES: CAP domain-containing protein [unclassified Gilvimarinus]MBU2885654.1 CAP domain-containing protein [Gilvimarinus agarilyticus]MDO6570513.1 CAP domain-containing protein [Gilvimarinus sp. 2_MG-2023]MDO6747454.1 CAP domain-containing protein [Gilvimarinus sp. 1_MG-2023]
MEWENVAGATGYNIFWAREPYIASDNIGAYTGGDWEEDVSSPHNVTGLTNNSTYYFVVTATTDSLESDDSAEVSATPRTSSQRNAFTAQEVLMVELINRARFDPQAEADRYGIDLNDDLAPGTISPDQKQPLAFNTDLMHAARDHSQWMLNADTFSHTGESGSSATQRMNAAGYNFSGSWRSGENIAVSGTSGTSINLTQQITFHHEGRNPPTNTGLFQSAYHRENILRPEFREVGTGQMVGTFDFSGTGEDWYLSSMMTQNFAKSGNNYFVTGVVYNDSDGDSFYDVGEGLDNIDVDVSGDDETTTSTGAYSIAKSDGSYTVTVTGTGIPGGSVSDTIEIDGANIKFDVIVDGANATINTW